MIYILFFVLSFTLTYLIKNYAIKKALIAEVNERSSHSVATPHGGGIAIAITWFVGLLYLFVSDQIEARLFYALNLGTIIAAVGLIDDILELSAKLRIVVFSVVSVFGIFIIGGLESINFGIFSIENQFITNIFALLLVLWYINLTNFIDGINGYLGMKFLFVGIAGFILFSNSLFLVLAMAVLGFLYWNWGNAKIFMGDVGSTLLGYTLAIITLYYANIEASNLWIWITLYGVCWFDATFTLLRRKFNNEKISQAHKKHAYQRLTQAGWSHSKVTLYALGLNVILFLLIYFIPNVAASFVLSFVLLYSAMKFVDSKKKFK